MNVIVNESFVSQQLPSWVSPGVLDRGRAYAAQGRVRAWDVDDASRVTADVQGSKKEPYRVTITFDSVGWPHSDCSCPFDWEPLCKHAVAVLTAWGRQEEDDLSSEGEPLPKGSSAEPPRRYLMDVERVERTARRASAKDKDLRVRRRPAGSVMGDYHVVSSQKQQDYVVTVRDAEWAYASCTCPDFRFNELLVCKHIDRVRSLLSSPLAQQRLERESAANKIVSLYVAPRPSHSGDPHPTGDIRIHVPPGAGPLTGFWKSGFVENGCSATKQKEKLLWHVSTLKRRLPVRLSPEVVDLLDRNVEAEAWERRFNGWAKDPHRHPAWKESVGSMRIRLHPYQEQGILFAARKRRAFLGDDMGLGKTVQGIGTALLLKRVAGVRRTMVVCPASLKFQWKREIERLCGESSLLVQGGARDRARMYREDRSFFWVLNYELLMHDIEALRGAADMVILDEAQRIKNWQTRTAKTVKSVTSPYRLVLTGTPMENRLTELHSLSEFLNPRALGPAWKLIPTYARMDEDLKVVGYENLDHLRARLAPFFLRRSRPEVMAQLPPRTDNLFWTPITSEQFKIHQECEVSVGHIVKKWIRQKFLTPEDFRRLMLLLNTMRIVSNALGQYDWSQAEEAMLRHDRPTPEAWKRIGSPKLQEFPKVLADFLAPAGQKVVVFSQYERMLRLAEYASRESTVDQGIETVLFHGGLSQKERQENVRRFLDDPRVRVFFSTDAGSVGLNLQSAANCVINLETPWNPAVLEQRIGRVHRQGQHKSVQVAMMLSEGCIEERIYHLVGQKKALFAGLFDGAKDIQFTASQKASFLEKVRKLVPVPAADPEVPRDEHQVPALAAKAVADVVGKAPPSPGQPAPQADAFDVTPLVRTFAGLFGVPADRVGPMDPIRIQRTSTGTTLHLPTSLETVVAGFRPLVEALFQKKG